MATASKTLQYKIGMDIGELRRNAEAAGTHTAGFRKELDELEKKQRAHRKSLEDLGKGMAVFGTAVVAGLGLAAKAAIDWETAWTGVRKTVDGSDQEMGKLEGQLRELARTLPSSHKEIAAVAEAAGQLGIKRQDIAGFTKTMIDLGQTTNLTAEEAATALAKFSNIMGTSAKDVDRLGSTLVALGNDGASTEKDIIDMALRIAGAGKQLHLTESQVLGLASALSSVGIMAEGGGSAISTTMVKIGAAVNAGGTQLDNFAKVAGTTTASFAQSFRSDAGGAVIDFLQGLGRMQKQGEDVFGTLNVLGLSSNEVRDTLLRAGAASDMFSHSLQVGSTAWAENSALTEEANKRYATSASKIQVAWNQIQDALINVGNTVVPIVSSLTTGIGDIVRAFQGLPGPLKDVVTWVGLAVGGIALIGGAALIAVPKIMAFRASMTLMAASGGAGMSALAGFGRFMVGPWGAAIGAGVLLLGVFGAAAGGAARRQAELAAAGKTVAEAIKEQSGVINGAVVKVAAKTAEDHKMLSTAKALGIEMGTVTNAILGQGDAYDQLKVRLKEIIKAGTTTANLGKSGQVNEFSDQAKAAQELLKSMEALVGGKNDELNASKNVDQATKEATASQQKFGNQMEKAAGQEKQAAEALGQLIQALDDTNGRTLRARSAERDYLASVADAKAAITAAAEARVQATQRVEAAERSLGSAQRSVKDAQEGFTRAQRDARDAQVALTRARANEVERLDDLNRSVSNAALDEEGAILAVERARQRLDEVKGKGTGGLDLREADLGLRQAEHSLADVRDRYGDLREEADAANKAGVEGSDAVVSAQRGVVDSARAVQQAEQGIADAIREVRDAMKDVARANRELNLLGDARTLDQNTEAGRRNAEILDRVAASANAVAGEMAYQAEKVGGAAAGAAAFTASLKATRQGLVATAVEFGMSREEAEKYADSVVAIPDTSSVTVTTPGSGLSLAELGRVRDAVHGIPSNKSIDVGVLSEAAIKELDALGFKTQTLPNGHVLVTSDTGPAQQNLDRFIRDNQNLGITVTGFLSMAATNKETALSALFGAQGGIVSFAGGGMHEDHRPQIARANRGTVRVWAEPETSRESYIPWAMDRRGPATNVLRATANGFGYDLMPRGVPMRSYAMGGVSGPVSDSPGHAVLEIRSDGSRASDFILESLRKSVRVQGGNVQVVVGSA